jgi:hypothetical protein
MRKVLFQASRTTQAATATTKAVKEKVTKEVEIPTNFTDLESFSHKGKQKITIGYNVDGTRIREEVDFVTAMFLEGYKLFVGKEIAPEIGEEEDEELNDALASLGDEKTVKMAEWCLDNASGKKRKELRDKIVAGTWTSPF